MKLFWVIEFTGEHPRIPGQVNYVCIRDIEDPTKEGFMDWTADIHEALQFSREVDATRFSWVYFWAQRDHIAIREHQYLDVPARTFPVLGGIDIGPIGLSVPWEFAETFRAQAKANHGQSLEVLAKRGGLSPAEMYRAKLGYDNLFGVTEEYAFNWLEECVQDWHATEAAQ